jgi:hypothetical protein
MYYNRWRAMGRRAPSFPLYLSPQILSSVFCEKNAQKFIPNFVHFYLLIFLKNLIYYNYRKEIKAVEPFSEIGGNS